MSTWQTSKIIILVAGFGILLPFGPVQAASIQTSKGGKALATLDKGETAEVGDSFVIEGSDGKPKAKLVVTAVKDDQMMSDIKLGQVSVGDQAKLEARAKPAIKEAAGGQSEAEMKAKQTYWNAILGLSRDTESVVLTSQAKVAMVGYSPFLRGSLIKPLTTNPKSIWRKFEYELGGGLEELRTSGTIATPACLGTTGCVFDIPSATVFGRLGWLPLKPRSFELALRTGADILFPLLVNSNVISYSPYTPLFFITGGVWARFKAGEKRRVPASIDAAIYAGNSSVTIVRLMFSIGYAWN